MGVTAIENDGMGCLIFPAKVKSCFTLAFLIVFGIIGIIVAINYCNHAIARHGEDAILVRKCMAEKGPIQVWQKPDGRVVNVCEVESGVFGLMITDGIHEVTSFIKEKMTRLEQVEQYLKNMNANLIFK